MVVFLYFTQRLFNLIPSEFLELYSTWVNTIFNNQCRIKWINFVDNQGKNVGIAVVTLRLFNEEYRQKLFVLYDIDC